MMVILDRLSNAQSSSQGTRLCKDGTHVTLDYTRYRTGNVKAVGYILTVNYGGNKPGDLCITRPGREMATGSIGRFYVQLVLITITSPVCPYLSSPLLSSAPLLSSPLLHQCQWLRACEQTLVQPFNTFSAHSLFFITYSQNVNMVRPVLYTLCIILQYCYSTFNKLQKYASLLYL